MDDLARELLEMLHNDGVSVEIEPISKEIKPGIYQYNDRVIKTDFTEHDKVFEDKIAELKEKKQEFGKYAKQNPT